MKKLHITTALITLLLSSISFADNHDSAMDPNDASCKAIAQACKAGGFERNDEGKRFWQNCMHPLLLGQTVSGVTLDAGVVKECRDKKILELQNMLTELQSVK